MIASHQTKRLDLPFCILVSIVYLLPVLICKISFQGIKAKNDLPPSSSCVVNLQAGDGGAVVENFQLDAEGTNAFYATTDSNYSRILLKGHQYGDEIEI